MLKGRGGPVFRRAVISLGGRVGASIAQALLLAFLARALGVDSFGVYAATYAACMFVFGIIDYGLTTRVLAASNLQDARGLFGALVVSKGAALTLALLTVGALAFVLDSQPSEKLLLAVAVLSAAGDALGNTSLSIQQGEKRAVAATSLLLGRRVIALVPFAFGLVSSTAFISLGLSGVLGVGTFFFLALRRAGRPTRFGEVLATNHSIFLAGLGPNIAQLDSAVVGAVGGAQLAGLYGASTRLSAPLNLAINSILQVLVPEMAGESDESRRRALFRTSRRIALVLAGGFLLLVPLAPILTEIMLGSAFIDAAPIVGGVIAAAASIGLSQAYLGWFYATKVPRSVGLCMLGAAIFRLTMCAVAAAIWGPWGLAFVLPITSLITLTSLHIIWVRHQHD